MKPTLVRCGAFAIASRTIRKTDGVDSTGEKKYTESLEIGRQNH